MHTITSQWGRFRALMSVFDMSLERYATPVFITILYRTIQEFTGLLCGFALAFVIVIHDDLGPLMTSLGFLVIPVCWFIINLAVRLALECAMAIFAINYHIANIASRQEPTPSSDLATLAPPLPDRRTERRQ